MGVPATVMVWVTFAPVGLIRRTLPAFGAAAHEGLAIEEQGRWIGTRINLLADNTCLSDRPG